MSEAGTETQKGDTAAKEADIQESGMQESGMQESVIERAFVKAVADAGGIAYKLNSLSANGLPDRLVLFFPGKCVFVELKAPGKMMRPLQRKRRIELEGLGFPVLCIDRMEQIRPVIDAIINWQPGTEFPKGVGARIPDIRTWRIPKVEYEGGSGSRTGNDNYGVSTGRSGSKAGDDH